MLSHFSHVQFFGTLWSVASQASLSLGTLWARIISLDLMNYNSFRVGFWIFNFILLIYYRGTIDIISLFFLCYFFLVSYSLFFFNLFILKFLASLGLCCCIQALSSCSAWASYSSDFSCWGAQALECRLSHGLSFSGACGIFPDQGLNLCPPHCKADS